jgi:transposase
MSVSNFGATFAILTANLHTARPTLLRFGGSSIFYIGIDIAKRTHFAAMIDGAGAVVLEAFAVENNAHGFAELIIKLAAAGATFENCLIGMESTGNYWVALHDFLTKHGFDVVLINPLQTDAYRRVDTVRLTKTDPVDALMIANLIRVQPFEQRVYADENVESLRYLTRYRTSLAQDLTALKNKATSLLDCVFPEYGALFNPTYSVTSRAVLRAAATPREVLALGAARLTRILEGASKNKLGRARADALVEAARTSVGVEYAGAAISYEVRCLVERMDYLEAQQRKLDAQIADLLALTEGRHLSTIPGVGTTLAAQIYSEIGDVRRFSNYKKLVAYAGLDAAKKQSGTTDLDGSITKRGSTYLRLALTQAADGARKYSNYFASFYSSKLAGGAGHYYALSCTARKLTAVVYALLKEGRPFKEGPPENASRNKSAHHQNAEGVTCAPPKADTASAQSQAHGSSNSGRKRPA